MQKWKKNHTQLVVVKKICAFINKIAQALPPTMTHTPAPTPQKLYLMINH